MKKIIGIGNALTDILIQINDDTFLQAHHLPKGSMQLIDLNLAQQLEKEMSHFSKTYVSGGSAANTLTGLAKMGIPSAFVGIVGQDEVGRNFQADMEKNGVKPILFKGEGMSGFCTSFISADGERTMATYLGIAAAITAEDITEDLFKGYDILHIEGYLLQNHDLIKQAVETAKKMGLEVSLDMASYNVVEENIDFLTNIIKNNVDIVFANKEESFAYTHKQPQEALAEIAQQCKIAVVKIGAKGSLVQCGKESFAVDVFPAQRIDTTGAGDLYASGFLAGYANGFDLQKSAKMGSLVSSKIVEVVGTKFSEMQWNNILTQIQSF